MIGIVIVGHAPLATGLLEASKMIFGTVSEVQALNLQHDTNLDVFVQDVQAAVVSVDSGDGVLVLIDLLGGSPGNAAAYSLIGPVTPEAEAGDSESGIRRDENSTDPSGGDDARNEANVQTRPLAMAITGVNLPMLLEALGSRAAFSLGELVLVVRAAGRDGIQDLQALDLAVGG